MKHNASGFFGYPFKIALDRAALIRIAGALPPSPLSVRALLDDVAPTQAPLSLAIGEPRHAPPPSVLEALSAARDSYAKYPPIGGTPEWRQAVVGWLSRRFGLSVALFEETSQILPLNGTREGLFMAAQIAPQKSDGVVLMPNPFYQVYAAAALTAGAKPLFACHAGDGPLAGSGGAGGSMLARAQAFYFCSPANRKVRWQIPPILRGFWTGARA